MAGTVAETKPNTINMTDLTANPARFARQMMAGHEYVLLYEGKQLARVSPLTPACDDKKTLRRPGLMAGKITVSADFDRTPDDLIAAMEGRDA